MVLNVAVFKNFVLDHRQVSSRMRIRNPTLLCLINIVGHHRDEMSKRLETSSNSKLRRTLVLEGNVVDLEAGLSSVPSSSSLLNLRQENRCKKDFDADPLVDVVKRSIGPEKNYIRLLHI